MLSVEVTRAEAELAAEMKPNSELGMPPNLCFIVRQVEALRTVVAALECQPIQNLFQSLQTKLIRCPAVLSDSNNPIKGQAIF